jgi:putative FmdB family regulatory protein
MLCGGMAVNIMPFYDLKCSECEEEFNTMARIADKEGKLLKCPKCGSNELKTVYKSVNILRSRKSSDAPECPNAHICGSQCRH